jgi:hypothetical protein
MTWDGMGLTEVHEIVIGRRAGWVCPTAALFSLRFCSLAFSLPQRMLPLPVTDSLVYIRSGATTASMEVDFPHCERMFNTAHRRNGSMSRLQIDVPKPIKQPGDLPARTRPPQMHTSERKSRLPAEMDGRWIDPPYLSARLNGWKVQPVVFLKAPQQLRPVRRERGDQLLVLVQLLHGQKLRFTSNIETFFFPAMLSFFKYFCFFLLLFSRNKF